MKYAYIVSGVVNDTCQVDPFGIFSPDYAEQFVQAPDGVEPGWLFAGGSFTHPPIPPAAVLTVVSMRQARRALLAAGLLPNVASALASLPSPQKEQAAIDWEFASTVDRSDALLISLGSALNLNSAALDALFIAADAL